MAETRTIGHILPPSDIPLHTVYAASSSRCVRGPHGTAGANRFVATRHPRRSNLSRDAVAVLLLPESRSPIASDRVRIGAAALRRYTALRMSDRPTSSVKDLPSAYWLAGGLLALALAIVLHAVFPRYEFRVVGDDGRAVVIYDRWSNEFQRANYDAQGVPTLTPVIRPF